MSNKERKPERRRRRGSNGRLRLFSGARGREAGGRHSEPELQEVWHRRAALSKASAARVGWALAPNGPSGIQEAKVGSGAVSGGHVDWLKRWSCPWAHGFAAHEHVSPRLLHSFRRRAAPRRTS